MPNDFKLDASRFNSNLKKLGDEVHGGARKVVKEEGKRIVTECLGQYRTASGTGNFFTSAKSLSKKHTPVREGLKRLGGAAQDAAMPKKQNATISSLYHQLIAKDQANTSGTTIADYVNERWYIPSVFAVKHHHDAKSYLYLVGINFGVQVVIGEIAKGLKLGLKALSKGGGALAKAAKVARKVNPGKMARIVGRRKGLGNKVASFSLGAVAEALGDLVAKAEAAIQDTVDKGAMVIYDKVEQVVTKPRKV